MVTRPRGVKWSCLTNWNKPAVHNVALASAVLQAASHTQDQNPRAVRTSPIQVSLLHSRRGWRPSAGTRHSHVWKGAVLPGPHHDWSRVTVLRCSHVDQQAWSRPSVGPWLTCAWVYMCREGVGSSPVPEMSLDFPWHVCCVSVKSDWSSICQNQNQNQTKQNHPSCNPLYLLWRDTPCGLKVYRQLKDEYEQNSKRPHNLEVGLRNLAIIFLLRKS